MHTEACNHQTKKKERTGHDTKQLQSYSHFLLVKFLMSYSQSVVCHPGVCFYGTVRTTETPGSHITHTQCGDVIF